MVDVRLAIAVVWLVSFPAVGQDDPVMVAGHQDIPNPGPGALVLSGDFDGDGLPDAAFRVIGGARVVRGLGDGRFDVESVHLVDGLDGGGLVAADFNQDGRLDLATDESFPNEVHVVLGQGDLSFAPVQDYPLDDFPGEVAVADLDRDGWPDLVVSHVQGLRFEVLLGTGGGAFGASTSDGLTGEAAERIALGDFDGDGDIDVAAMSAIDATVSVLPGDGAGGFGAPQSLAAGTSVESLGVGDLDGNGRDDVLCAGDEKLRVFLANNSGGFLPPGVHTVPGSLLDIALADLDEDGHLDVTIRTETELQVLRGLGGGGLAAPLAVAAGGKLRDLALADYDLDGEIDFIGPTFGLTVVFNRGDLVFGPGALVGTDPEELVLADFDDDGRLDVAAADQEPTVSICLGKGDGWLGTRSTLALTHVGPAQLATDDFDGDGDADLAAASQTQLRLWSSLGDGSFAAPVDHALAGTVEDLAAGDLNGDHAIDLMALVSPAYNLEVFFNDRAGSFFEPESFPLGFAAICVVTGDLNADGDLDVASLHGAPSPGVLRVHLNDGAGGLLPATVVAGSEGLMGLSCADADGDGHLDLLTSDHVFTESALHYGHGDGTFDPAVVLGDKAARGSTAADVDADGIPDVLIWRVQSSPVPTVGLYRGLGGRAFAPLEEQEIPTGAFDLAIGDMNQDGVLDAVAASFNGREVRVLLSTRGPWDNLLEPLAGTAGYPHQTGVGTLVAGQPFSFSLKDARPAALAWHIVGIAALNANFKGGTMVPFPTLINGPFLTNAQGKLVLAGNWPAGAPAGLSLYTQFWIQDPGGPVGFASSNALRATLP